MAIPQRWLDYSPIGQKIEGTRFIAFKVPLRCHLLKSIEDSIWLDSKKLLKKIPNLGLIIDLTNTNKYYSPDVFESVGIEYRKLMIPGHEIPPRHLSDMFNAYIIRFLNRNKDNEKLIGVHCTHGVNRTGYLICNYMISVMLMPPDEAITKFGDARGHRIERQNYLAALQNNRTTATNDDQNEDDSQSLRNHKYQIFRSPTRYDDRNFSQTYQDQSVEERPYPYNRMESYSSRRLPTTHRDDRYGNARDRCAPYNRRPPYNQRSQSPRYVKEDTRNINTLSYLRTFEEN